MSNPIKYKINELMNTRKEKKITNKQTNTKQHKNKKSNAKPFLHGRLLIFRYGGSEGYVFYSKLVLNSDKDCLLVNNKRITVQWTPKEVKFLMITVAIWFKYCQSGLLISLLWK